MTITKGKQRHWKWPPASDEVTRCVAEPRAVTDQQLQDLRTCVTEQHDAAITTPSRRKRIKKKIAVFKPKDAGEYRRAVAAREIVVTRNTRRW